MFNESKKLQPDHNCWKDMRDLKEKINFQKESLIFEKKEKPESNILLCKSQWNV